jgi:hypothetical protein
VNRNDDYADQYITGYTVHSTSAWYSSFSYLDRIGFLAVSEDNQTLYLGEDEFSFHHFDDDDYIPIFYQMPL